MSTAAAAMRRKVYDCPIDLALIHRVKEGDEQAFNQLYTQYYSRVHNAIQRVVNNEDTAIELANTAFLRVWMKIAQFREDSSFATWITRIAINAALMYLRKNRSQPQTVSLDGPMNHDDTEMKLSDSPMMAQRDARLEGTVDTLTMMAAINRVPPAYRTILLLRHVHGMTAQEVAASLGMGVGAVKSTVWRGRQMVINQLTQWPQPPKAARGRKRKSQTFLPVSVYITPRSEQLTR